MSLPPKFSIIPASIWKRTDVPIHLRWTYIVLYSLAWKHDYTYVTESYDELANIFAQIGDDITPRGIRERIQLLAGYGLVERQKHFKTWRTYLHLQHPQGPSAGGASNRPTPGNSPATASTNLTPSGNITSDAPNGSTDPGGAAPSGSSDPIAPAGVDTNAGLDPPGDGPSGTWTPQLTPPASLDELSSDADSGSSKNNNNNCLFVDLESDNLSDKQTDLYNTLRARDVSADTARELARTCDPKTVADWIAYIDQQSSLTNPAGFLISRLRASAEPPKPKPDKTDPARYVTGKYSEYVQH